MAYGGVEALLIPAGTTVLGVRFATDVPADLATAVPFVQLVRVGGPSDDNDRRFEQATVSVDSFAVDRVSATALAYRVDSWLRSLPNTGTPDAVITKVQTLTGPSWRPWEDVAVRRIGASYRIHLHHR